MNLDHILLDFSEKNKPNSDLWQLEDAFKGIQIFGSIGSGKTSGSGKKIASAFLKNGFGGIVLCAKPSEREDWEKLIKKHNRYNDLKIFCKPKSNKNGEIKDKEFFFNPLEYEASRLGGGETFNLVNLFMQIYQMGKTISGEGLSNSGDRFWDNALKRYLSRMIDFLKLAGEPVTIYNMYRLVSEALTKKEIEYFNELRNSEDTETAFDKISEWAKFNYYVNCFIQSRKKFTTFKKVNKENQDEIYLRQKQLQLVKNYFEREFANLAEKTKTIVVESFLGLTEPFQSGILEKYFAGKTTIFPEETFEEGKIIILDFPIKDYLDAGIYAQGIFKLLWQQAVERRKYKEGDIPVFLWVDEAHNFLSTYDSIFQSTARSAGVSTVFLSQNISNYYSTVGGKNPKPKVDSLLGNLSTKIFHANNDPVTNEWAARVIGKSFRNMQSFTISEHHSAGMTKQLHWQVEPKDFTTLKSGGKRNQFIVHGIVTVSGRKWQNKKNYILYPFKQNFEQ